LDRSFRLGAAFRAALLTSALLAFSGIAQAYQFSIDSFTVIKNGSPLLVDNFISGNPPPEGPLLSNGNPASYSMVGTMGPENADGKGRLILNQSGAVVTSNIVGGGKSLTQAATLNINIDSLNTNNGLKKNHTFSIIGLFDLLPVGPNERYGIRLTDRGFGAPSNDVVDLRVMEVAGVPHIQFREVNEIDQARIDFFIPLDTTHDQIALILDHPTANSDAIFGRFQYFDGGVGGAVTSFLTSIDIFNGELFTVPRFNAQVGLVSEPLSLALVLTGLALVGWLRSRRIASTASLAPNNLLPCTASPVVRRRLSRPSPTSRLRS
jgi:hypothetical protein